MTASSMLERVYRAGYSREYVKLARAGGADMVLYDPIYAAAQQVKHRGGATAAGAAREVRSKAWQKFLEASAPYRAGLTVGGIIGVPTGAVQYAQDKDEKDQKKRWARAALAGTLAGLPPGLVLGSARHRIGKQLQNASGVLEKQTLQGRVNAPSYSWDNASDKVYRGAVDAAVSGAPTYRARGGAADLFGKKDFVTELPFSEVAETLRKPSMNLGGFGEWGEEGARALPPRGRRVAISRPPSSAVSRARVPRRVPVTVRSPSSSARSSRTTLRSLRSSFVRSSIPTRWRALPASIPQRLPQRSARSGSRKRRQAATPCRASSTTAQACASSVSTSSTTSRSSAAPCSLVSVRRRSRPSTIYSEP